MVVIQDTGSVVVRGVIAVCSSHTLHGEWTSGRGVEGGQLLLREPARHQERADGDQEEDEDREADGGDGLGDGKSGAEPDQFQGNKSPDCHAPVQALETV